MPKTAFIDESGNHNLDTTKPGSSSYFIVCAIIVDDNELDAFNIAAEKIRQNHFHESEIKSSKVRAKDGHKRRIKILNDILDLKFTFYALAVDKNRIYKDSGLQHKRTFIKNLNGKLYGSLFQHFAEIKVIADETGNQDFSRSFKRYVDKNHIPDLFSSSSFGLASSQEHIGVQIADFIAGTLAQVYENKSNTKLEEEYEKLIKQKSVGLDEWPPKFAQAPSAPATSNAFDKTIMDYAFRQAHLFLDNNSSNHSDDIKMQVCALDFLIFQSHWNNAIDYVPTHSLKSHLRESGYSEISDQVLRSSIIAKLRDADVLIASSNKGYKIPSKLADLHDFVARVDSQAIPLLKRLNKARKNILMATSNEVDILQSDKFPALSNIISKVEI